MLPLFKVTNCALLRVFAVIEFGVRGVSSALHVLSVMVLRDFLARMALDRNKYIKYEATFPYNLEVFVT